MQKFLKYLIPLLLVVITLNSCGVHKSQALLYNPKEVAEISRKLGIPLNNKNKEDDKHIPLYAEVSLWLGTPYKYGGNTKRGVDCSGFTCQVYKKIYRLQIPRSTADLAKLKKKQVSKKKLRTGDLVLFATNKKNKKKINHVGIYLKDNYFIHASTSSGVIVSNLNDNYFKNTWRKGLRLK